MWHYRAYEQRESNREVRQKAGHVQDLKGSGRYEGSSPYYQVINARQSGSRGGSCVYSAGYYHTMCAPPTKLQQSAYNNAYDRMRSRLQDGSTLGTTIAEGRETLELIAMRGASVLKALRKLRKGDPKGFAYELAVPKHQRRDGRFSTKHWLSGHWLEYWLGIAPTIADIEKSVEVLVREHPQTQRIKVAAFQDYTYRSGSFGPRPWPPYINAQCNFMSGMYVQVRVNNPNVFLATQLGLTNPVAIAWELVPLSFVVDWFYDVGGFLNSFDTFYGLEIVDGGTFTKTTYTGDERAYTWNLPGTKLETFEGKFSGHVFRRNRATSFRLPRPVLELPHVSWTRAATSISLLTQFFS